MAHAQRAARVALDLARSLIDARRSFALETSLAGRTHPLTLGRAGERGFRVQLPFFAVPSPEVCLERVAHRVAEGGHDVPGADLRRSYARNLANLPAYAAQSDLRRGFDNAGAAPVAAAEGSRERLAHRGRTALPAPIDAWLDGLPG